MRKLLLLCCCSFLIVLFSACGHKKDDAVNLGENFIKKLYTVEHADIDVNQMSPEQLIEIQDGFSPYLTKDGLEELLIKNILFRPLFHCDIYRSRWKESG